MECPLKLIDNHYHFDFVAYERNLSGDEKMVILCSPHNPGGRVWTKNELQEVAKFAKKHDLVLVSDEIHHDLVYPNKSHTVMPIANPSVCDRLVMMTATTKTFNIAGAHSGNVIISNPNLRQKFSQRLKLLGSAPIALVYLWQRLHTHQRAPSGSMNFCTILTAIALFLIEKLIKFQALARCPWKVHT